MSKWATIMQCLKGQFWREIESESHALKPEAFLHFSRIMFNYVKQELTNQMRVPSMIEILKNPYKEMMARVRALQVIPIVAFSIPLLVRGDSVSRENITTADWGWPSANV